MKNQGCNTRPKIINAINNEPVFYPCSIKVSKCSGSCNNINYPYAKLCVPDIIKNINFKVCNLMQRINETRNIIWPETCKCICRLTASVSNSRQIWNEGKCRCECREELIDKGTCNAGFIFNPSTCEWEYDKSCGIGQYFDSKNCLCRNSIGDILVKECTNFIDENKIYNETLNEISSNDCASCTIYSVFNSKCNNWQ